MTVIIPCFIPCDAEVSGNSVLPILATWLNGKLLDFMVYDLFLCVAKFIGLTLSIHNTKE